MRALEVLGRQQAPQLQLYSVGECACPTVRSCDRGDIRGHERYNMPSSSDAEMSDTWNINNTTISGVKNKGKKHNEPLDRKERR